MISQLGELYLSSTATQMFLPSEAEALRQQKLIIVKRTFFGLRGIYDSLQRNIHTTFTSFTLSL